ncbi:MAG: ABC transporter ATP-binding protein [Anaerolineaceae bacterium]
MSQPILSISNLEFSYEPDQKNVLDAVSFDILPGTITAILGPNGAGKTTLIHLLLGLRKPISGSIHLKDRSIGNYSRKELSQWIGLVPQSEYVPFEYSVLEYVLLGRAPYLGPLDLPAQSDIEIAHQALILVGIEHLEMRPIPELSGGELQLVLIARALAQQPKVLLLDEPTSHLDLSNRNITLQILNQLRLNGVTVLFTTHDPEAASLVANNLVLMRQGKVLHTGSLEATFTSQKLSETYGTHIDVLQVDGLPVVRSLEKLQ